MFLIFFSAAIAAPIGYFTGREERESERMEEIHQIIQEQFALGLVDLEEGRYEIARQRFEYVIKLDPNFPDAPQRLAQALLGLNKPIATPTLPPVTATPNLAPVEEILSQAQEAFKDGDWTRAIETLLALRAKDSSYRAVEVDGLMFAALRNRGVERISREQLLEEGMYDLSLAETFGPLDEEAENWRSWAQLYLTANSFMFLNWEQATFYFDMVFVVAPGIKNDVYWKYALAAQRYADQLVASGDPCAAMEQYEKSLGVQPNETLVPTGTKAYDACQTATALPPAPPKATETPAIEATPTEGPSPSDTPGTPAETVSPTET